MLKWEIVHDGDLEDGTPTLWSVKIEDGVYYWIDWLANGKYAVIDTDCDTVLFVSKTLRSAKTWLYRKLKSGLI